MHDLCVCEPDISHVELVIVICASHSSVTHSSASHSSGGHCALSHIGSSAKSSVVNNQSTRLDSDISENQWISQYTLTVGVSQKVMSEIRQKIKSVIRFVIKVTMKRNQKKVRQCQKVESARKFLMVGRPKSVQSLGR
eukprot:3311208-Amphidinium_carterae.1